MLLAEMTYCVPHLPTLSEHALDAGDRATLRFGDPERMRRAFVRLFGAPPSALRRLRAAGSGYSS
jgi:hypothetical protein